MGALFTALLMALLHVVVPMLDLPSSSTALRPEPDPDLTTEMLEIEPPETHIFAIDPERLAKATGSIRAWGRNIFAGAPFVLNSWNFTRIDIDDNVLSNSVIEVDIDLGSMTSWAFWRLPYIKGPNFLNVEDYPVANVKLFNIDFDKVNIYGIGSYTGMLELRVKDAIKHYEIDFVVTARYPIKVQGELVIKRSDIGLWEKPHPLNIFAIRDEIVVRFSGVIPNHAKPQGFPIFGDSGGKE